jgi:DNA-binding NarL/FixJ family response regulator
MRTDRPAMDDHGILALLSPEEDSLARSVATMLGLDLTVVRTRQEFELRAPDHHTVIIGYGQPGVEQLAMIRRAWDADDDCVIAAIGTDPGLSVDLLEAGADAIVQPDDPPEKLSEKIRAAREGHVLLDPDETVTVLGRLRRLSRLCVEQGVDVQRCEHLTPRERNVVALLARRATNAQIAEQLGVAVGTVKNHVHSILAKLEVENRGLAGVYWRVFTERAVLRQ